MSQEENETREDYLTRLLANLADAVIGGSWHDLAGYGYEQDEINEVSTICREYWDKIYPR